MRYVILLLSLTASAVQSAKPGDVKSVKLAWSFPAALTPNISFDVACNVDSTPPAAHWGGTGFMPQLMVDCWNITTNWVVVLNTQATNATFAVDKTIKACLFAVRTRDASTGRVSPWAYQ